MKIGYLQFAPEFCDPPATLKRLAVHLDGTVDVDLLVLPELCNSGYNFASQAQAEATAESAVDGPFVQYLTSVCRRNNCHIVAGLNESDGDRLYNSSLLIGPKGPVGKFRKVHLFLNEFDIFTPGDLGVPVFDIGDCRVAMLICFDWCFPEVWRMAAIAGADIVCHPSNLILPGKAQRGVPVHAMINGLFVITANRFGREGDLSFTGNSFIADPKGEILIQATDSGERLDVVEIDIQLARDKAVTPRNDRLRDRRPEVYKDLISPPG